MISAGRVMNWSNIEKLEDGATLQVMGRIRGGMGKVRKEKKGESTREIILGIQGKELGGRAIRGGGHGVDHGETSGAAGQQVHRFDGGHGHERH